jgi:hypothetical protein
VPDDDLSNILGFRQSMRNRSRLQRVLLTEITTRVGKQTESTDQNKALEGETEINLRFAQHFLFEEDLIFIENATTADGVHPFARQRQRKESGESRESSVGREVLVYDLRLCIIGEY